MNIASAAEQDSFIASCHANTSQLDLKPDDDSSLKSESQARVWKWVQDLPDFKTESELLRQKRLKGSSACSSQDNGYEEGWEDPALYYDIDDPPPARLFSCLRIPWLTGRKNMEQAKNSTDRP